MMWEIGGAALAALLIAFAGTGGIRHAAPAAGGLRAPGGRHTHRVLTPMGGGIAVVFAMGAVLLAHPTLVLTPQIWAMLAGTAFLLYVGLLDDRKGLWWPVVLISQSAAALLLAFSGAGISYVNGFFGNAFRLDSALFHVPSWACFSPSCVFPLLGTAVTVLWVVAVVNAFNWLDGSHDAAASVGLVAFATVAVLSLRPDVLQPPMAIIAAAGGGALAGFLFWNITGGRVFLGNAGSFSVGFFLASLAVLAGAKFATVAMVLLLPGADAASVATARVLSGARPWSADTRHFHHLLLRRNVPAGYIAVFYASVSAFLGWLSVELARPWKLIVLLAGFVVLFVFLLWLKRKEERTSILKSINPAGR